MDAKSHFNSLYQELNITAAKARRLTRLDIVPESLALEAERITDGALRATDVCPSLDTPQPSHSHLANTAVSYFAAADKTDNGQLLLIQVLNFLERSQPSLYKHVVSEIEQLDGGVIFIANRCGNGNG